MTPIDRSLDRPSMTDLRGYALSRANVATAERVRRYLLLGGDDEALAWVASLAEAQRRVVRVTTFERGTSLFERVLGDLGLRWPFATPDAGGFVVPSRATPGVLMGPGGRERAASIRFSTEGEARWLYVVAIDVMGAARIVYPEVTTAGPVSTTSAIAVADDALGYIGIASVHPLVALDSLNEPAVAQRLLLRATAPDGGDDLQISTWQRGDDE